MKSAHMQLSDFLKGTGNMAEQGTDLSELLTLTTDIVASHVSNNGVPVSELPQLIQQVYATLAELGKEAAPAAEKPQPAGLSFRPWV